MAKKLSMKQSHVMQIRMAYMDRRIREGKYPNCAQVAREFNVERKTVQRDINYMRELGAPLQFDKKRSGYFYTEKNYFLPAIQITQSDVFAFLVNEQILKLYQDAPYYDEIKEIIEKIIQFLPNEISLQDSAAIFSFSQLPVSHVNRDHFKVIQKSAYEEKKLKIKYLSQHSNKMNDRVVDPYAIKNHNGIWYLIAFCHQRNEVRVFAMNRILAIETTDIDFYKPTNFSTDEFFKDSFSIYRTEKKYHVKLKFSPYQARWIRERQWHKSQQLTELEDGGLILEMEVQGLDEVKRWVMQYGGEVEVVEPEILKCDVIKELEKMNGIYKV